jgi:hypothetical protein
MEGPPLSQVQCQSCVAASVLMSTPAALTLSTFIDREVLRQTVLVRWKGALVASMSTCAGCVRHRSGSRSAHAIL